MKKLSKILLVILSLIIAVTAITVVSFAEEATEKTAPFVFVSRNFDGDQVGSRAYEANHNADGSTGKGYFAVAENVYETSNKYLEHHYEAQIKKSDGSTVNESYSALGYNANPDKRIESWPYVLIDFDIMKTSDTYSPFSVGLYTCYTSDDHKTKNKVSSASKTLSINKDSAVINALSEYSYEWSHLSFIFYYHQAESGTRYTGLIVYVNGDEVYSNDTFFTIPESHTANKVTYYPSNFYYGEGRIGNANASKTTEINAYDNVRMVYFTSEYEIQDVLEYSYTDEYQLPYGKDKAKIGETEYDFVEKAIADWKEGDVITLIEAPNEAVTVNTDCVIDTAGYAFEYLSTEGYEPTVDGTVYTFKKSSNIITVRWDPVCEGECDCYDYAGGHIMTSENLAVLGNLPIYELETPTFEMDTENYLKVEFAGWSYENDGTVDELVEINAEDVMNGVLNLYPVYEITYYGFEVTSPAGAKKYYSEKESNSAFNDASSGSTIKLLRDVNVSSTITISSSGRRDYSYTFDLNGYTYNKYTLKTNRYEATYNEETGEYVKGDLIETITEGNEASYIFYLSVTLKTFTLTSSRPDAMILSTTANVDEWVCDGKVVKTENQKVSGNSGLFSLYPCSAQFYIDGKNITYYGSTLFYGEHGSNTSALNINVDGGTYVIPSTTNEGVFGIRRGGTHTIKNATFIALSGQSLFRGGKYEKSGYVTFENCNIIDCVLDTRSASDTYEFINCRIAYSINTYERNGVILFNDNNLLANTHSYVTYAENCAVDPIEDKSITFDYHVANGFIYENGKFCGFTVAPASVTKTFKYETVNLITDYADVTFVGVNGETVAETRVKKNSAATAPAYAVGIGDGYRGVPVTEWKNESGVITLTIGDGEKYEFTAVSPTFDENTELVAFIPDAMFNFIYYGQFHTVLYLPVKEGMDAPTLDASFAESVSVVKINGDSYWAYTRYCSTTGVADEFKAVVSYTIDGVDYTKTFTLSALLYAKSILTSPENDTEAKAVANMVRYVKEARLAAGLEVSEKFAELESLYALDDYKTKDEYKTEEVDYSSVSNVINSISFMIDGNSASYVFTLNAEYMDIASLKVKFDGGKSVELRKSTTHENSYYSTNTRVYDLVDSIEITVTVTAEDGTTTSATGTYSIGAYIAATDNNLAKSIYEFGLAAADYREYLLTK